MLEYTTESGIAIRVGQSAKENDILTFTSDPQYWWLHASGYPGAHVVVCYKEGPLSKEVKRDAAVLAIHHSKTPETKMSWVDVTQVSNVTLGKHRGLVTLNGHIEQPTVFKRKENDRLERLLKHRRKIIV